MSAFSTILRQLRAERGLNQSRLAERANLSHSHVSRLESGDRQPSRPVVSDLAAALGCTDAERDVLLLAAGFTEGEMPRVLDFNLLLLDGALQDEQLPEAYRQSLHDSIGALLRGCEAVRGRRRVAVVQGRRAA
jgi:transcriptional regulator with XRE-family HTH domain